MTEPQLLNIKTIYLLANLILRSVSTNADTSCCTGGWKAMPDEMRCVQAYKSLTANLTFDAAELNCTAENGGHLVSVRSAIDQQYLQELLYARSGIPVTLYWIGGIRSPLGLTWTDGYEPVNYTDFGVDEGLSGNTIIYSEAISRNGWWLVKSDDYTLGYWVCEKTCATTLTTTKPPGSGTGSDDPHFITFDGLKFDSQTTCPYILSQPCNKDTYKAPYWSIIGKNTLLPGRRTSMVTFIELSFNGHTYAAEQQSKQAANTFKLDGTVKTLPYDDRTVKAHISAGNIYIETIVGVKIQFTYARQRVTVPSYPNHGTGVLCGLLGDFDGNCSNDMIGRDGKMYAEPTKPACVQPVHGPEGIKAELFADTWITERTDNCILGAVLKNGGPF